jgi:predicted transcriptional regulator
MQSISARIDDETHARIEELAEERGSTQSAVVRRLIEKGLRYDDLETERDRLQRQLAAVNAREDDVTEIVEYVEEQRSLERRRAEREERRAKAGVLTKTKWALFGMGVGPHPTSNPHRDLRR